MRLFDYCKYFLAGRTGVPGVKGSLKGRYDLRGDRIWGWVAGEDVRGDGRLTVEAQRHNVIIAACVPTFDAPAGRRTFTLPIEGRFTPAELVNETVVIAARNERGDTGILNLEGPTQLELIRESFAAPAVTILDLDFTLGGNASAHLGAGWSAAEADFTWTNGYNSFITFHTPHEAGIYPLGFTAGAFVNGGVAEAQVMQIFINDNLVRTIQFTEKPIQFNATKVDSALFSTEPLTTLRFHHPYPIRPCGLLGTNRDRRRLAFCFKRLTIARLLPID